MRLNEILDAVNGYAPNADIGTVMRAYVYSARAHAGQMRKSGEPYLTHPIAVAGILADLHMDVDTIATGLLHDTMEDCLATYDELAEQFGTDIADLVDGVTKIGKLEFRNRAEAQAENFRKLVLAMAKDVRVILVKLADRLHNMRTLEHMEPDRQGAIAQETMDIFAPIANRLGLSKMKSEFEDLCFRYLHPEVYESLREKLEATQADREEYIQRTCAYLRTFFEERGLSCEVTGRSKHLYSIYRKMQAQNLEFEQVHDLLAFRVIVESREQCYTALGHLHGQFRYLPDRFKDYISVPKSNNYQSLHTCVHGPEDKQIEVQIRTAEMHRVAEVGIAAHWRYKEGHLALSRDDLQKIARLRALFDAAKEVDDSNEFLETAKVDLFSNEIFAFTPKGDVRFFPPGATVLDFAYTVHTEVGNHCTGARVNGRMVPLRYQLHNGETVEILTSPAQKPNRDWLEIAKTGRALTKIRRHLREEERRRGRELGRELLENALKKKGQSLQKLIRSGKLDTAARSFGFRQPEALFLAVSQGDITVDRVLRELLPPQAFEEDDKAERDAEGEHLISTFIKKLRKRSESPVLINGEEDVLVGYAHCCNPLPGESVMGYITRGRGITVHLANCPQLLALDPERRVPVEWHSRVKGHHTGVLKIVCTDQPGMLAEIAGVCKQQDVNVNRLEAHTIEDNKAVLNLEVAVEDVRHLTRLMRNLEKIRGVLGVERVRAIQVPSESAR